MKFHLCKAAFVAMIFASVGTAHASTYSFYQDGFDGGGIVTGTFSGIDLDNDGQLVSFFGEVTLYSMTFSGNATVSSFSHTFSDLYGLVYDIGSGFIGDGMTGAIEGIASNWPSATTGFVYATGPGPTSQAGGWTADLSVSSISSTSNMVVVSAVPVPAAVWLFGSGLVGLFGLARRRARPA